MKVLLVSPVPTDPLVAGNRARIAALFAALVRLGHDVSFAYIPYETADYERMRLRLGDDRLHVLQSAPPPFPRFKGRLQRKIGRTFGLRSAHLWKVDEWFDEGLIAQVRRLQAKEFFDCVLIEYVFLSKLATHLPTSVRTIIDTHDLMGDRHKRYLDAGMTPQWFATTRAEEVSALNRADAVLAIQQDEANYLKKTVSAEVFCVGHLVNLDIRLLPDPGGARILFVGSANPINVQGLEWFLELAFPRIQREMPDCELAVAGEVSHARSWPDRLVLLGNQDSLVDAYAQAAIVINPVKFGTGLPVKTVEALTYGKPVVATSAGIRGLEDFSSAIFSADDPDAFAGRVLELLRGKNLRLTMSQHAVAAAGEWQRRQMTVLQNALAGQTPAGRIKAIEPAIAQCADEPLKFGG